MKPAAPAELITTAPEPPVSETVAGPAEMCALTPDAVTARVLPELLTPKVPLTLP